MRVLVTGGLGYIGSNVSVALVKAGHEVTVLDNLWNASISILEDIEKVTGFRLNSEHGDVRNTSFVKGILDYRRIDAVVHCAGRKSSTESLVDPIGYYDTNVGGTISMLRAAQWYGLDRIIFSGSATVYSPTLTHRITESSPKFPSTPYGESKYMAETILQDYARVHPQVPVTSLRYFNPVGAHESGLLGDNPDKPATNLLPVALRCARDGKPLQVYGTEYQTPDGTAIRDYVNVTDLAEAHVRALEQAPSGYRAYNIGTGFGASVLEVAAAVRRQTGKALDVQARPPRKGDAPRSVCDPSRAREELGWTHGRTLDESVLTAWWHLTGN